MPRSRLTNHAFTALTGVLGFDPAQYAKMLENPKSGLLKFTLSYMEVLFPTDAVAIATPDVFDSSPWVRMGGTWKCVAHAETEADKKPA